MSPASSADMAPISSGSSTWTSSGIPFSFVSMATGIGPSSSGSQATVASVLTSTLLAGLGFSGGVISSFPSSVWPSGAQTHNPTTARQTVESPEPSKHTSTSASAVMSATVKDNSCTEDDDDGSGQGQDGEKEEEKEEGEEDKENDKKNEKRARKGSKGAVKVGRKDNSTAINEPRSEKPAATAKVKNQTEFKLTNILYGVEDQLEYTQNPPDYLPTTALQPANKTGAIPAPRDPTAAPRSRTGGHKRPWSFSIHTGEHIDALKPHTIVYHLAL